MDETEATVLMAKLDSLQMTVVGIAQSLATNKEGVLDKLQMKLYLRVSAGSSRDES
jgi:hypothetical protein